MGAFYGPHGCTDFFNSSTATSTLPILDSGYVDFLAAPGVYNNREPGGSVAQKEMQIPSGCGVRCLWRRRTAEPIWRTAFRDAMGLYDVRDSIVTLKRDFARVQSLCEDIYAWWFDQHAEGGRYQHEEIYKLFRRQEEIAQFAYGLDRNKENEIALIYDQEKLSYRFHVYEYAHAGLLQDLGSAADRRSGGLLFSQRLRTGGYAGLQALMMMNVFRLTDENGK